MTTSRVVKVAWRFGVVVATAAAILAPRVADAAWYRWVLWLR
jgi:hypothetical protein